MQFELPQVTKFCASVSPWGSIALAVVIVLILSLLRFSVSRENARRVEWTVIILTAMITLFAIAAFVSPMYAVVQGLGL